jgi:undecaprenyl-diphosphatase
MVGLFHDLLAWVSANTHWAYFAVFLVAMTESLAVVGLIVPGVIMMLGAGALIAIGALDFWPTCLWAVAGAIAGDGLSYWLGHHFKDRLRGLWPFSRYPESLAAGERFFARFGGKSVAFGRFVGPVRAVIPLVAGMMGMSPYRFLVANLLSALAWAPAYLLPGIVFGASMELAAEAAVHLVLVVLILVIAVWGGAWMAQQLFLAFSPRAGRWVEGLLRWGELHPRMGEIARALADPSHPDARTLAALAGTLVLATALFGLAAGLAVAAGPGVGPNRVVLDLALSLHSPGADHLMVAASRLADLSVLLPLGATVLAWLLLSGRRRHAIYWLAAVGFALSAGPLVQMLVQVPRPDIGLIGLSRWSFPSDHTLRATVVYGFLAVSLAGSMSPTWRWLPYVWATTIAVAVGVARSYLGAVWLTDTIGGMALGLVWVAALGLSLRRHTRPARSWRGLETVAVGTLLLAFVAASLTMHDADMARYRPVQEPVGMTAATWREGGWRALPRYREDLRGTQDHPLNLQYAGDPAKLADALEPAGWARAAMLAPKTLLKLLSPATPLSDLPVIPHVHDRRHGSLVLVREMPDDRRLVLRLWATPYRIDGVHALWVGEVTSQHKRVLLDLLAVPTTDADTVSPMEHAIADLAVLHPLRPDEGAPLLVEIRGGTPND